MTKARGFQSNKSIFLRSIDNPSHATQYTSHTTTTTVARFSPSGYYVASGDVAGTVRVWDCVGEGATKGEYPIISGRINDLAWDGDSQRIIAVGDGKEKFGHCITADSGNTVGEISGHSSQINSVSIRQQRPLRAATGSDDTSLAFFHGTPFKFNTSLRGKHQRYIYGVAFSSDGSHLVSVGSDKKIFLYDGKTGEAKGQIGDGEHTGSIFAVSWARDSKRFVTSSADQTVKIWDAEAGKAVQSWRMGEESRVSIPDHQVGVVWPSGRSDDLVVSLSLAGDLNYLSEGTPKPQRVVQGHQKNITTITSDMDNSSEHNFFTGSSDGRICSWDTATGNGEAVDGDTHKNYVSGLASSSGRIYSVGWDDTLRSIDISSKTFTGTSAKTDGQPRGVVTTSDGTVVATHKGISILSQKDNSVIKQISTSFSPTVIAAGPTHIAVGGDDSKQHMYEIDLKPYKELQHPSQVTALAFSPSSNRYLAVGFASGKIIVYEPNNPTPVTERWSSHTARVTSIDWDEKGEKAVSGSLDTNIFVWSIAKPGQRVSVSATHKEGVNGVRWLGKDKIISVGGDAAVKIWKVEGVV